MKFLFYFAHPAHFHLFKNIIISLKEKNHKILIAIQKKDVLEELVLKAGFPYENILMNGRGDSKISIVYSLIQKDYKLFQIVRKFRPDIMVASGPEITHIGKLFKIPSLLVFEDDLDQVAQYAKIGPPFASALITPWNCRVGKWQKKQIGYNGLHELCYLSPKYFTPNIENVSDLIKNSKPYFILRFSRLEAYHDVGKKGISSELAQKLSNILGQYGNIYITSEKMINGPLSKYIINIHPANMHDALYYADLFIGDSQTMTAEAAVLGTPALRFNDFVGKLSYLNELEHKYDLTYGIQTNQPEKLIQKVFELIRKKNIKKSWQEKRDRMLSEKIDVTSFLVWFIENYPDSFNMFRKDPNIQYTFK